MYEISFISVRKAQWWLLLVCKKHFGYNPVNDINNRVGLQLTIMIAIHNHSK